MAQAQTDEVIRQLAATNPGRSFEKALFETSGDRNQSARLTTIGGKGGAFVDELRAAIRNGTMDAAMHSLKDIPGNEEVPGLVFGAYLVRESSADCLVLRADKTEQDLRQPVSGAPKIGTSSARRKAFISAIFPSCEVIHFRGAVVGSDKSRLAKLDQHTLQDVDGGSPVGPADALVLASSGLRRVGQASRISREFSLDEMLPAVGQGVVVVECRANDFDNLRLLSAIDHQETRQCAIAEREMLWILDGHCDSPIAGICLVEGGRLSMRAAVLDRFGTRIIRAAATSDLSTPRALGRRIAFDLISQGARDLIEASRPTQS